MDYSKIVFTLELDDDFANEKANNFMNKGWLLISVGTKMISILDNGQAYYSTSYVVGATQELYDQYLKHSVTDSDDSEESLKEFFGE